MEPASSFRLPKALTILLCAVVFLALLTPFVCTSYGLDGRYHLYWIQQFTAFNAKGILFPRWIPDSFGGFGSAAFYFYPPVTYYFASLIRIISGITAPTALFQIISLIASVGSFFSMRILLKSIGSSGIQRTVAAALYMIAPVRYVELYHRGDLSTHVSYVFIPLVWYAFICVFRSNVLSRWGRIALLAVSSVLLALTSVPVAMVTGICIFAASIAVWKQWRWNIVLDVFLAIALAIGLSAFHLSAAISAMPYTWLDLPTYHIPFVWKSLLGPYNWLGVYEIILVYVPVVLIFITYWKIQRSHIGLGIPERIAERAGLCVFILILFLDLPPLSRNLWNVLIPLQLIGLSWRLYSHILLGVCMIVGIAKATPLKRTVILCTALLVLGAIGPAMLAVSNEHLFPHFTRPLEDAMEYRPIYTGWQFEFERIIIPHSSDAAAMADFTPAERFDLVRSAPGMNKFDAELLTSKRVTFHRFYWPFWHLYTNGGEISSLPDSIGRAVAMLPAGHYTATWRLERTPLESDGIWISGILWTCLVGISGIGLVRRSVKKKRPTQ